MKKIPALLILVIISLFILVPGVWAADLNIDCSSSGCSKTGLDPFFDTSVDGLWYPGKIIGKTINFKNSQTTTREMAIRGNGSSGSVLENVLQVSISPVSGGSVIWSGSLRNFYSQARVKIGIFAPEASADYNFSVSMNSSAGNEYQGLRATSTSLSLGVWDEPVSSNTSSSGGGSSDSSGGVSVASCDDSKPGSAPVLLSATVTGPNQVTLNWEEADSPVSYYLVVFGLKSGEMLYGNPNVGGAGTTSFTVNGLSGGTIYYFKVRAGNGCTPGDYSNELSAIPGGQVLTNTPGGFEPGVLGVAAPESTNGAEESSDSAILGAQNNSDIPSREGFFVIKFLQKYGWILLISLLLLFLLYRRRSSAEN